MLIKAKAYQGASCHGIGQSDFSRAMSRLGPFEDSPHLAVALSGGADSTAMLSLLQGWCLNQGGKITALIVDHGLRLNSAPEAALALKRARSLGLECRVLVWEGKKPKSGVQEAAREARYGLIGRWCRDNGVLHLAVGHHIHDNEETIEMRSDHGSGTVGLAGISAQKELDWGRIIRPCLGFTREALRQHLLERGLSWVEDSSNEDCRFERVRVRKRLSELSQPKELNLHLGAKLRNRIELTIGKFVACHAMISPLGYAKIKATRLLSLSPEIAQRVLGGFCVTIGSTKFPPRRAKVTSLLENLRTGNFQGRTLGGCQIILEEGYLIIFREWQRCCREKMQAGFIINWDSRFNFTAPEVKGITVGPLGDAQDPNINEIIKTFSEIHRIPRGVLMGLPALFRGKTLLAVPNLGYGKSSRYVRLASLEVSFRPQRPVTSARFEVA
ncbi:MAG: tRNA lysidine(34) synthetase TilS [Rhodospirillaceae bacterium]